MSGAALLADADALRAAMVERVFTDDTVEPWSTLAAPWRDAFASVPRHLFISPTVYVEDGGRPPLAPLHRDDDPARWLRLAYGSEDQGSVVVQVDDGDPVGPDGRGRHGTSSASGPVIVAIMLAALDAQPGERVLEIGTGTGYNAALLAHRLGAEQITSVEVDPVLAERARLALRSAGFRGVCVVTGDGVDGYAPRAPYDRLIATVGVREIPPAWITQTRPGGRVVMPLHVGDYDDGTLVALVVDEDGEHASGAVVDRAAFMPLRSQRPGGAESICNDDEIAAADRSISDMHPWHLVGTRGARFTIGLRVPDCHWRYEPDDDGRDALWLLDFVSRSWAKVEHPDPHAETFAVLQYGERRLFDEVEQAWRWWDSHDRPGVDRWRFTVGPEGQRIELAD